VNSLNCEILTREIFTRFVSSSQLASNTVFADIYLGLLSSANKDNVYKLHIFEKNDRSPKIMSKIPKLRLQKQQNIFAKIRGVEIVAGSKLSLVQS
jgi:hypothetical protein